MNNLEVKKVKGMDYVAHRIGGDDKFMVINIIHNVDLENRKVNFTSNIKLGSNEFITRGTGHVVRFYESRKGFYFRSNGYRYYLSEFVVDEKEIAKYIV
ncbi:MAG: hypothetical protein ACRDBY_14375 [Cetobacterium sp.]